MLEIERRLRFLVIPPNSDDVFVFIDNHVLIVLYSQRYINTLFTTLGKSMFSCGQIYIDIKLFSLIQQNSIFKAVRQIS